MEFGMIRQGDILLAPVEGADPPPSRTVHQEVVLAEGEVTGHAHRLSGAEVLDWSIDGQRYVRVNGDAPGSLRHEDHDPVAAPVVPPNVTYRVIRQREWDLSGEWRPVVD